MKTAGGTTVAITNPVLSEFKDYEELVLADNGQGGYTYQRVNIAEYIYNSGQEGYHDVYMYNDGDFVIYQPALYYETINECYLLFPSK